MCLAKVYQDEDSDEPVLEDIAHLTLRDGQVEVETLFGETRVFTGRLREIDFVRSRIVFEP